MANRILLADDSITIQKVVNLTFSDEGIDVVTVGNGDLALKKLREEPFDLVLADIFMPGTDGYRLCEFVKSQPEFSRVPVILLVGAFEPFDRSEAARVRADGHLTKPFESRVLVETVRRMLAAAPPRPAAAEAPKPAPSGWSVEPVADDRGGEPAPEPPGYDPYASTAKLPALQSVIGDDEAGAPRADQNTTAFGSPFAFDAPAPEPPAPSPDLFHLDVSTPFVIGADPSPVAPAAEPLSSFDIEPYQAAEEPPASYDTPAAPFAAEPAPAPSAVSPIGYQPDRLGDSPLELDDLGVVERHAQPVGEVLEVRDPLLDTFDDVKESTAGVDSALDPGLVTNAQPEGEARLGVRPVDGLVSGFEQAPADPTRVPPPPSEPAWDPNRTQVYSPSSAPFEAAQPVPEAEAPGQFDIVETADEGYEAYEVSEAEAGGAGHWSEPSAPGDWQPESVPPPADDESPALETQEYRPGDIPELREARAAAAEAYHREEAPPAAPAQAAAAVPPELIEEVVRRTVERMSDDVIREIAWEVVPDLAEALIRKHLAGR